MKKFFLIVIVFAIASCVSKKDIVYFQKDEIDQSKVNNSYTTIFKPDDLLQITVSATDLEAVKPFNLPAVTFATTTNSATGVPQQQTYLVDNKGVIDFPIIGKIKIGGLTREQAIELLKNKLDPDYVKNPTINIRISNFKITILGDVKHPGTFTLPNERISILEAIGLAGDLNITGKRQNIIVHREIGDKKVTYELDLTSRSIFSSPAYYLQQNDVVYIEPNKASSQSAAYNKNSGLFISIAGMVISIITLITR